MKLRLRSCVVSMLAALVGALVFGAAVVSYAGSVGYSYDALGRLANATDPSGNEATYNYDAAGNLLSISRGAATSDLSISGFSPASGPVGTQVTISGSGFAPNVDPFGPYTVVEFNGVANSITSWTQTSITVTVPSGATTGPITVISISTGQAAVSGTLFTVQ